jgi:hypothetical protein
MKKSFTFLQKTLTVLTALSTLAISGGGLVVHADAVAITLAPTTIAVSTGTTPTLAMTTTAIIPIGGTIQVLRPTAGYTGAVTLSVSAGAIGATATTTSGTDTVYTATVTTAIPVGALTITTTGLTSTSTAANNAFKVYTSAGDYGANFQYVGKANEVTVRARVPMQLAFVIRDTGDTANTNVCDLGDLTTTLVNNCEYRLKVTTNAKNGYTINVQTSGNLTDLTNNFANAVAGPTGTVQTAGTEIYGVKVTPNTVTGASPTVTLNSAYTSASTNLINYTTTSSTNLVSYNKPNSPAASGATTNTTLVRHEAAISGSTPAGLFTQTVTYTVSPSF